MKFEIRALGADNTMSRFVVEAPNEADARQQFDARGIFVASILPAPGLSGVMGGGSLGARPALSVVLFSQELLALLNAGLAIVEALEALLEKEANEATRALLGRQLAGLREGKRFSDVLAQQPDVFPALYVGMIKAAEGTSGLPRALERYIDYRQRVDALRNRLVSSAIYPVILLVVGGAVSFFLLGYVVPRFAEVYRGAGRELPWMSQMLLAGGAFIAQHGALLVAAIAGAAVAVAMSVRRFVGGGVGRLIAHAPWIGERARIYELSRLYLSLGMLIEGGIPVVTAMAMAEDMASEAGRAGLRGARNLLESGLPLSAAFESNGLATPISLRLLRVGERSGQLGAMLTQSAQFYDGEISRWIDRFTRALEPVLMTAIGGAVGLIVILLYMPIFDLAGSLS